MILEQGEYFAVTRGFKWSKESPVFMAIFGGESWKVPDTDEPPRYDRGWEGVIFQAEAVCGELVAARILTGGQFRFAKIGQVTSLDLNEIEVMPLTLTYVRAMGVEINTSKVTEDGNTDIR